MRTWFAVLALSALALGCSGNDGGTTTSGSTGGSGGSTSGGGSTGSSGGGCTITASGAVSKTVSCTASAGYSGSDDKSSVAINAMGTEFVIALSADGELSAQTYDGSNGEVTANVIENGGQTTWIASTTDGEGSASVVITSVTTTAQSGGDSVYAVHGSATATLVPAGAGGGQNVTLDVSF